MWTALIHLLEDLERAMRGACRATGNPSCMDAASVVGCLPLCCVSQVPAAMPRASQSNKHKSMIV